MSFLEFPQKIVKISECRAFRLFNIEKESDHEGTRTLNHLKSSPTFSVRPCSSVGRVTVDLIRRSWVRFLPRSKDFIFASCGSLFPFTRANAQWVIHGFKVAL